MSRIGFLTSPFSLRMKGIVTVLLVLNLLSLFHARVRQHVGIVVENTVKFSVKAVVCRHTKYEAGANIHSCISQSNSSVLEEHPSLRHLAKLTNVTSNKIHNAIEPNLILLTSCA